MPLQTLETENATKSKRIPDHGHCNYHNQTECEQCCSIIYMHVYRTARTPIGSVTEGGSKCNLMHK